MDKRDNTCAAGNRQGYVNSELKSQGHTFRLQLMGIANHKTIFLASATLLISFLPKLPYKTTYR